MVARFGRTRVIEDTWHRGLRSLRALECLTKAYGIARRGYYKQNRSTQLLQGALSNRKPAHFCPVAWVMLGTVEATERGQAQHRANRKRQGSWW